MYQGIDQQMPTRIQAKDLAVEHVGNPCERMPVGGVKCRECPRDSGQRQAAVHNRVLADIPVVIQDDELVVHHLGVHGENHSD